MARGLYLLAAVVSLGCGNGAADEPEQGQLAGPCAAPAGQYEQATTLRAGSCPPLSPSIVNLSDGGPAVGTFNPMCNGTGSTSTDGCKYQVDVTCPATPTPEEELDVTLYGAMPPTVRLVGTTNWNATGTLGSGVWSYTRVGSLVSCTSTYDVELAQL